MEFFWRIRKKSFYEDRALINSCRMPYYNSPLLSLYAYGESVFRHGPYHSLCHAYWSLQYIQEGELFIKHEEMKYHLRKGDLLVLYPGNRYDLFVPEGTSVSKKGLMINNSPLISLLCNQSILKGRELLRLENPGAVDSAFERIRDLAANGKNDSHLPQNLANAIFALFTELIAQCGRADTYNSFDGLLAGISNFSELRSLDLLAKHFKVGKWTLNRLFKKHLNCTPLQYLIFSRMKYASQLLCSNALSIKAVAEECGYRSPSFFSAEFKKYFGKTPLEFREELPIFSDSEMKKLDAWGE